MNGKLSDIEKNKIEQQRLLLHYAADTRKFEIQLFWQRSLYFWGLVAASIVAFAAIHKEVEANDSHHLCVILICFGFLTSVAWALQSRGSKYWHEAWEQKVHEFEEAVLGERLFWKEEAMLPKVPNWPDAWLRSRRYSVTKISIAMGDLSVILWCILAVYEANLTLNAEPDFMIIIPYLVSIVMALLISIFARSKSPAAH